MYELISPSQRSLADKTQHSQQTDIHAPSGIRTHDLSRRAAEDLRFRLRGHWDRPSQTIRQIKSRRVRLAGNVARKEG